MPIMQWPVFLLAVLLVLCPLLSIVSVEVIAQDIANTPIWNVSFDSGGDDYAMDVVSDSSDNIFVGGVFWNSQTNGWSIAHRANRKNTWPNVVEARPIPRRDCCCSQMSSDISASWQARSG